MKYLFISFFLIACTITHAEPETKIFNNNLILHDACKVEFNQNSKPLFFQPSFSVFGHCRIVTHTGTNIIHTKYVNGMYVFFIENNIKENNNCHSEYSAFGISKDNSVYISNKIKRSGQCQQDKETHDFEYYAATLKPLLNSANK